MRYQIFRVNPDSVIDFAAQELKKYLRMMMPRCGDIKIGYNPNADCGFRLGLMSDFGIDSQVANSHLDDVFYIKCDENGGIIAGSNERSVLISVYRYLKEQGCRWLFPGPDGEKIPRRESVKAVSLNFKADNRYRGQCIEGSLTQQVLYDAIDYMPKIGMNTFMMQFDVPAWYYNRPLMHSYEDNVPAEGWLDKAQLIQWKRKAESEIAKRGLVLHDVGHGWTVEPFGYDNSKAWDAFEDGDLGKNTKYIAMLDGKRAFNKGVPINTNICMSNPEARDIIAKAVADYAQTQDHVDFIHVWLADECNNHCECEKCAEKTPSDWYVILLNDIDAELEARNLKTQIVFIAYVDTLWAPLTEKLNNTERFTYLFAPIHRYFTESYLADADPSALQPYVRNKLDQPKKLGEVFAYLQEWKKDWKGDCISFDYYFWIEQYYDLGVINLARNLYDDIQGLKKQSLQGTIQCGSQRSFFPNGFLFYLCGEAMLNSSISYDELAEEYFSAAYGEKWKAVYDYLNAISNAGSFDFLHGDIGKDDKENKYYNPEIAEKYKAIPNIIESFMPIFKENSRPSDRTEFVCWDLLKWHMELLKLCSKAAVEIGNGKKEEARDTFFSLVKKMAPLAMYKPSIYDHDQCMYAYRDCFSADYQYKKGQ